MPYSVVGSLPDPGTAYSLYVDPAAGPEEQLIGSPDALALLRARDGDPFTTADGQTYKLDLADEKCILAALRTWTHVSYVVGDAPATGPPKVAGVLT